MSLSRSKPPLLPSEVLRRVQRLASMHGSMVLWLSGIFAILSASASDISGALAGCLAAGAGAMELHGSGQLRARDSRGVDWLVRSQFVLLATTLLYCAFSVWTFDFAALHARLAPFMNDPRIRDGLEQMNISSEEYIQRFARLWQWGYIAVGVVSIFYQGGLARYYYRRKGSIEQALESPQAE